MNRRLGAFVLMMVIVIGVLGRPVSGHGCDLVEKRDGGQIDWTRMTIEASGVGVPSPDSATLHQGLEKTGIIARQNAYRNLLELTKSMQLTADQTVGQYMKNRDILLSKIEDRLKGASVVSTRYLSDGTVKKTLKVDIKGSLLQLLLPDTIVQLEMKTMGEETSSPTDNDKYTGLLVDARGVPVKPALVVQLVDEGDQEVYGPAYVSRNYAVKKGFCGYVEDIKAPEVEERVGGNPLIVKALRVRSPGSSDLVVSNTDASRIRSVVQHLFFLRQCRVLVVVDNSGCGGQPEKHGP